MSSQIIRTGVTAGVLALSTATAWAHPGEAGHVHGFAAGFAHPIGGLDHVLAMVAVGLLAATLGGRALWAVPATFVLVMAAGGALGVSGVALPYTEIGIALSVVVLGLLVALRLHWSTAAAMAVVALFAVFHGHAHGTEMPLDASGVAYAAGFMSATALLHLAGIGLGILAGKASAYQERAAQVAGGVIALAGVAILAGIL